MTGRNKFDATASMIGYLYQCRYALLRAIEATREKPGSEISIERFDDVAFESDGNPVELIQTKHHLGSAGDLTDSSADLWKTIRVWSERVADDPATVFGTQFFLITTASAPEESAASFLKVDERDEKEALRILEGIAATSKSQGNAAAYKAFYTLSAELRLKLLEVVTILDQAACVTDLSADIAHELHHAAKADHLDALIERLEGWWLKQAIASLSIAGSPPIPVISVEAKIDELREAFQRDALPVDFADVEVTPTILAEHDNRPFVRQLRRIKVAPKRIEWAIRDYYRAFEQRSKWARDELLVDEELGRYERGLVEAWEPRFEQACEDCDGGDAVAKVKVGKAVYKWAETEADFPLRSVRQRFLTHGSFHILANRLAVGWHPDFKTSEADSE